MDSLNIHHFNGFVIFHQADTPKIQFTGFIKHLTLFTKCKISLCKHVLEIARHIFNEKKITAEIGRLLSMFHKPDLREML